MMGRVSPGFQPGLPQRVSGKCWQTRNTRKTRWGSSWESLCCISYPWYRLDSLERGAGGPACTRFGDLSVATSPGWLRYLRMVAVALVVVDGLAAPVVRSHVTCDGSLGAPVTAIPAEAGVVPYCTEENTVTPVGELFCSRTGMRSAVSKYSKGDVSLGRRSGLTDGQLKVSGLLSARNIQSRASRFISFRYLNLEMWVGTHYGLILTPHTVPHKLTSAFTRDPHCRAASKFYSSTPEYPTYPTSTTQLPVYHSYSKYRYTS